ncbi:PhzF family phenazine biosynthesis protein [Ramlibacter humi]|uniref:PhzF family phenazine biosynthesis protein n=1 Tax=Ramlibacter humi TaxID=2530451 RepID=A0A4Z0BK53_9BURK|nr:PhzF family phenazine biosynthesis protein [Ramlibacter humi]TFY98278.1 PhzF family phenazine biosynthesis protein [Ramlibacter humi]
MNRPFKQVDVFTAKPYLGNPVAVVLDGKGLTTEQMQGFTRWTNLSEATFVLPPEDPKADYKVRIFTTSQELPFAGHPTLGTCHAWLEAGGRPKGEHVVQECGIGLVNIRRDGERLAFAAPPLRKSGPLDEADLQLIARGLRIAREDIVDHAWCDNGPGWRGVMLRSAGQVLKLQPDGAVLEGLFVGVTGPHAKVGVVAPRTAGDECAFEVRAFFPSSNGTVEDPVTGSLNAALAQWLTRAGYAGDSYVAAQGTALGRAGRVHVQREGAELWIGGQSVTCIDGQARL